MYRRYAIKPQIVKIPKSNQAPEEDSTKLTPEQFSHVAKEQAKNAALLIGAGYTTKVILDTAREIALHIVKTKIR